jgi:alkylation response protein AidB-like acyl-CoA dehydrogenase
MTTFEQVRSEIESIATGWAEQRPQRQQRRHLERDDFDALARAGFLLTMVPRSDGGLWDGVAGTTRPICELLRTLGAADPSVALVSSMHPAVLSYWMANPTDSDSWRAQAAAVVASAKEGSQWGTVTSEPGSGGDIAKTRTLAQPADDDGGDIPGERFLLTGDKHFGSGTGITHYMITTARAEGADEPAIFFLDVRQPTDAIRIVGEWDGAGMAATQSHTIRLEAAPATRMAFDGSIAEIQLGSGGFILALFTSVILGVVDAAIATARHQLEPKKESLGAFEQTEWARADTDHWLAVAAYERLLTVIEAGDPYRSLHAGLRAKSAVAELAESILNRIVRVVGGGSYARRSPFAHWYEDVRALGFLRPPWALTADNLFATSFT